MRNRHWALPAPALLLAATLGCTHGGDGTGGSGTTSASSTGTGGADVGLIGDVLPCKTFDKIGGLADAKDPDPMQRLDIDVSAYPDALCNDGTGAVLYFRPYVGDANKNKWLIELQGGGACRDGDSCARRFCGEGTNFSATQMSVENAPKLGIDGDGIEARIQENTFGGYNQVFVKYCSSDSWLGTARDVVVTAADPRPDGTETFTYRIHFLGSKILDAAIGTLRRELVPATNYTEGATAVELPDLDEAEVVVFAGASAGGTGVVENTDRVGDLLRSKNVNCGGSSCPLDYRAFIDSTFALNAQSLDYSTAVFCTAPPNLCTYDTLFQSEASTSAVLQGRLGDPSCIAWHTANEPGSEWKCTDTDHVIRHHVTTPMFIRTGQQDSLHLGNLTDANISLPGTGLITPQSFAAGLRAEAGALANLQTSSEEGGATPVVPGAFIPSCKKHDTLEDNANTFGVTIPDGPMDVTALQTFDNWVAGKAPATLITAPNVQDTCP